MQLGPQPRYVAICGTRPHGRSETHRLDSLPVAKLACTVCEPDGTHVFDWAIIVDCKDATMIRWRNSGSPTGRIEWSSPTPLTP